MLIKIGLCYKWDYIEDQSEQSYLKNNVKTLGGAKVCGLLTESRFFCSTWSMLHCQKLNKTFKCLPVLKYLESAPHVYFLMLWINDLKILSSNLPDYSDWCHVLWNMQPNQSNQLCKVSLRMCPHSVPSLLMSKDLISTNHRQEKTQMTNP